ncbi:unnamed protein product [Boreogadus saida]
MKHVEFEKFDFFILVSADRFSENDAKLAKEIKKMGKKLFLVRSKIDHSLSNVQRRQQTEYDEEKTLQEIRKYCIRELEGQGVASPQVFLVSCKDLHLYEFPALQETMERELPSHKRGVLILALPNICKSTINKKKEDYDVQSDNYPHVRLIRCHNNDKKSSSENNSGVTPAGQCGDWVKELSGGSFTSPNYPEKYPADRECIYIIEASPRQCIDLFFLERYSIEPSWDCKFDQSGAGRALRLLAHHRPLLRPSEPRLRALQSAAYPSTASLCRRVAGGTASSPPITNFDPGEQRDMAVPSLRKDPRL